jgi:hypothetical protein
MKIGEETSACDSDTSFESDSEMITSSDSYSDASTTSSGDTTPAEASGSPIHSVPSLVQRGPVPSLSFSLAGLQRGDEGDGAPPTMRRRGVLVDRLSLPALSIDAPPLSARLPLPATSSSSTPPISVDIISPAFTVTLNPSPSEGSRQLMVKQCSANLGIPSDRLNVYSLTQLPLGQDLPTGCTRVAVEVAGSKFSLQAVEDLLAENQKLSVNISSSQQQSSSVGRQFTSNNNNNQQEMEELHQQLEKLTKENTLLKAQLNMSESLRQKGHQALGELKHEFRALYKQLTTDAAPPFSSKNNKQQQQREGTPAAVQEGGLVPGSV